MREKKNYDVINTKLQIVYYSMSIIGYICTAIIYICLNSENFSLYAKGVLYFVLKNRNSIAFVFIMMVIIQAILYIWTRYNVDIKNLPLEEVKSAKLLIISLIFLGITIFVLFFLFNKNDNMIDSEASNLVSEIIYPIEYNIRDEKEDNSKCELTPLQQKVDELVKICYVQDVSVEKWRAFTSEELYYIRNGIYAYAHRIYESGFYDIFPWYNGNISPGDFQWDMLNSHQQQNVKNIQCVEDERKKDSVLF